MTGEDAERYIERIQAWAKEEPVVHHVLGIDHAGDLVGVVKLRRVGTHGRVSYVLREDTWGSGYATEAVKQLVVYAFTTASLDSLGAKHHPNNPASGRVLTKVGFECVGTSNMHAVDGVVVPHLVYELHHAR